MLPVVPTLLTGLVVLVLDLGSKWLIQSRLIPYESHPVIPGFFHLTYVLNPGAAFGLLANWRWPFIAVSALAILLILVVARHPRTRRGYVPYALGLMLGGTAGNLTDRIRYGRVVDFLEFFWRQWHYPVFNLADVAILTGVGLFILHLTRESWTT